MAQDIHRRDQAIRLRSQGLSIKAIALKLSAAQSSVSIWTRNVILTEEQTRELRHNTHSRAVIEKRRTTRLYNESLKRQLVISEAENDVFDLTDNDLFLIGCALYWAEGGKTRSMVRFSNGDPRMIKLMIKFFNESCAVNLDKMRVHIHIHESLSVSDAEEYWSKITELPRSQFYKTYSKRNISSKGLRSSLPYGVCDIYILDAKLQLKLQGWANGITSRAGVLCSTIQ